MSSLKRLLVLAVVAVSLQLPLNAQVASSAGARAKAAKVEDWVGARSTGGRSQGMVLHIIPAEGGVASVDLPDFGATGIPGKNFSFRNGTIHFELVSDSSTAVFDGSLVPGAIQGHWKEGEHAGEFTLRPAKQLIGQSALLKKNLAIQNGDVRLSGTLVMPSAHGALPLIVFVQGAGPETRTASLFMAEYFARRGIAAFIYDKRGAGESTGDWKHASFEALASDVEAVVNYLGGQREIDPHRIGLMGSSQGGWVAPMAALHLPQLAFVIAKSAAAMTPEKQELARVARSMTEQGASPADIAEGQSLYRNAISYARSGIGWDALDQEIKADSTKPWAFFSANTPKDFYFFDQIRLFFAHDPIPVLEQVRCPLLVIFGGKDDDAPPIETAIVPLLSAMKANGKSSELEIFPNAGHDLRIVPDPTQPWDFGRFATGYMSLLGTWVDLQVHND